MVLSILARLQPLILYGHYFAQLILSVVALTTCLGNHHPHCLKLFSHLSKLFVRLCICVRVYSLLYTGFINFSFKEPSGHPSELQIIKQTSSTVTFRWKELDCYEENGPIIGYQYRAYYGLFDYIANVLDSNTTMVTLSSENMLSLSVAAMNEAGIGDHCPPTLVPNFDEGNELVQRIVVLLR